MNLQIIILGGLLSLIALFFHAGLAVCAATLARRRHANGFESVALRKLPAVIYLFLARRLACLLPEADYAHPVLHVKNYLGLKFTPALPAEGNSVKVHSKLVLQSDGSAVRYTEVSGKGIAAIWAKAFIERIGKGKEAHWARNKMRDDGYSGQAQLHVKPDQSETEFSYGFKQEIDNFEAQPEASELYFKLDAIDLPLSVQDFLNGFTEDHRINNFSCQAFRLEETMDVVLPKTHRLLYLPKNASLQNAQMKFYAKYRARANGATMSRYWHFDTQGAWCKPQQYPEIAAMMREVDKLRQVKILYADKKALRKI